MKAKPRSLNEVAAAWRESPEWQELRPRTQAYYEMALRAIDRWGGDRQVARINRPVVASLLASYADRPGMRHAIRATLANLFRVALDRGWAEEDPTVGLRFVSSRRSRDVTAWTAADVELYGRAAAGIGWPSGERLLHLMWEVAADQTDVSAWTHENFLETADGPAIRFTRGKTGQTRVVPISDRTAAMLRGITGPLILDLDGRPFLENKQDDDRRHGLLRRVRTAAVAGGARRLVFDHIRHSALTHAVDVGASYEDAKALSAHGRSSAVLEQVYVQQSLLRALAVQRARGLVS